MSFVWFADKPLRTREEIAREVHAVSLARGLDELATVMALMCIDTEVGANDKNGNRQWWCPWNAADATSKNYSYDSQSNDGRSVGYYQQQNEIPGEVVTGSANWWGNMRSRMTLALATDTFLTRLTNNWEQASNNPSLAGQFVQDVQGSAFGYRYAEKWDDCWTVLRRALATGTPTLPVVQPTTPPAPDTALKPDYIEIPMFGNGYGIRRQPPINAFWHTEQGNSDAKQLARYCDGSNNVSYHNTIRDGIVCNVVDTDYYSWSVLDANVFSINYCLAGSYAEWTREEWLKREKDIAIMCYLTVQDCKKYPTIATEVIAPPYGSARPGISDHKYVTQVLGIGTHTDLGNNFPWDRAKYYVNLYLGITEPEEDDWMATNAEMLKAVYDKVCGYPDSPMKGKFPSRSMFRDSEDGVDDGIGMVLNTDATAFDILVIVGALLADIPDFIARIRRLANGQGPAGDEPQNVVIAQALWKAIPPEAKKAAETVKAIGE